MKVGFKGVYITQTCFPDVSISITRTVLRGFRTGPTLTGLYSHRRMLEAWDFGFEKKRVYTIRRAKTKALISFAVTAKLICAFIFAYAKSGFLVTRLTIFLFSAGDVPGFPFIYLFRQ